MYHEDSLLKVLCLLHMVLKTGGLSTGTTFMRGSYVVQPDFLAWLCECTVLVKSEHELHHCKYTENIINIHRKSVLAFTPQSNLSCAVPTWHECRIHKPVLGTHYSSTVPCCNTCTNHDNTVIILRAVT